MYVKICRKCKSYVPASSIRCPRCGNDMKKIIEKNI